MQRLTFLAVKLLLDQIWRRALVGVLLRFGLLLSIHDGLLGTLVLLVGARAKDGNAMLLLRLLGASMAHFLLELRRGLVLADLSEPSQNTSGRTNK